MTVGQFVKIVSEPIPGRWMIVTVNGYPVGRRLDRQIGNYPDCRTRGLTLDEAATAFDKWEKFCKLNQRK